MKTKITQQKQQLIEKSIVKLGEALSRLPAERQEQLISTFHEQVSPPEAATNDVSENRIRTVPDTGSVRSNGITENAYTAQQSIVSRPHSPGDDKHE